MCQTLCELIDKPATERLSSQNTEPGRHRQQGVLQIPITTA